MFARALRNSTFVCFSVWLVLTSAARADLISNGDFEYYSPFYAVPNYPITDGGWTFANHAGVVADVGNPGKAARLESGGSGASDPTISQTITGLNVGTTYTVQWDLRLGVNYSGSGTGRSFGVFLDNQTYDDALYFGEHLSTSYVTQSVGFVASATSHTLIFAGELDSRTNGGLGTTDVSYRIDNIQVVPEPSSAALCLTCGVCGIGWVARRRRGRR